MLWLAGRRLRIYMLVVLAFAGWSQIAGAQGGKRVALIIANSAYKGVPRLSAPVADARLIAASLTTANFEVMIRTDLDRIGMETALKEYGVKADQAEVALLYFAGHGIEIDNVNYLLPVDAKLLRDRDAEFEAVKLSTMVQQSDGAKRLKIIILDACRNNPFSASMERAQGTRSVSRGLMRVEPSGESLIVYSAKAGTTASDGAVGGNSPFARALATRLAEPGNEINMLFRQVRDDVLEATGRQQEPFTYGSLSSKAFYFVPPRQIATAPATLDMEGESWAICRGATTTGPCEAYLAAYPAGRFVALTKSRLADLAAPRIVALQAAAAPVVAKAEDIMGLGLSVLAAPDRSGIYVRSVRGDGLAVGQLMAGDLIVGVDSAAPDFSRSFTEQLDGALRAQGRLRLLVKRGVSTSTVIMRAAQ